MTNFSFDGLNGAISDVEATTQATVSAFDRGQLGLGIPEDLENFGFDLFGLGSDTAATTPAVNALNDFRGARVSNAQGALSGLSELGTLSDLAEQAEAEGAIGTLDATISAMRGILGSLPIDDESKKSISQELDEISDRNSEARGLDFPDIPGISPDPSVSPDGFGQAVGEPGESNGSGNGGGESTSDGEAGVGTDGSGVGDQGQGSGLGGIPVILDLDDDGIELTFQGGLSTFDMDEDGYRERTAWAASDDAFLTIDLGTNNSAGADGVIDQLREISFAAWTDEEDTDLQALGSLFDTNGDGQFDANDDPVNVDGEVFGWDDFRVWQDHDQDGVVDHTNGELHTLDGRQVNGDGTIAATATNGVRQITSVGVTYTDGSSFSDTTDDITVAGNVLHGSASYSYLQDGVSGEADAGDVTLAYFEQGFRLVESDDGVTIELETGESLNYLILEADDAADVELLTDGFDGAIGDSRANALNAAGVTTSVIISGAAGNDTIAGGAGSDLLSGDEGTDTIIGGAGDDLIFFDSADAEVEGGEGYDVAIHVGDDGVVLALDEHGLEAAYGSAGNDDLSVSADFTTDVALHGGGGADILSGGAASDVLSGDDGDDELFGNDGSDYLLGGAGNDSLDGGKGFDFLIGGAGDDVISGGAFDPLDQIRFNIIIENADKFGSNHGWWHEGYEREVGDVDGDGQDDVIGFGSQGTYTSEGTNTGKLGEAINASDSFGSNHGWWHEQYERRIADVNGDGRADIIGFGSSATYVALGQADGTFGSAFTATTAFGANSSWGNEHYERRVGDVNGDGHADIIGFGSSATYVALGQADGTFGSAFTATTAFGANSSWGNEQYEREVADVNGDGQADIIGFGSTATFVALGQVNGTFGNAFTATTAFASNTGWGNEAHERRVRDVNDDGKADIIGFGESGVYVAYGRSDGTFDTQASMALEALGSSTGWGNEQYERRVGDVNGDGIGDLIAFGPAGTFVVLGTLDSADTDFISGGAGDDEASGGHGNDLIFGGDGNDILNGGKGNDIVDGGNGSDQMNGGEHVDTFVFRVGDGQDIIQDFEVGVDTIEFRTDVVNFEDLTITTSGANALIAYGTDGDTITLEGIASSSLSEDLFLFSDEAA